MRLVVHLSNENGTIQPEQCYGQTHLLKTPDSKVTGWGDVSRALEIPVSEEFGKVLEQIEGDDTLFEDLCGVLVQTFRKGVEAGRQAEKGEFIPFPSTD